jgi:endo-1,4-beta-xylanase
MQIGQAIRAVVLTSITIAAAASGQSPQGANPAINLLEPKPIVPGAKVVTLWPAGSPALKALKGYDQPEVFNTTRGDPARVQSIVNIHNPSIELHLAPADKANGMAVILAAGGGNRTLNVGTEGVDIAQWLNSLGISAFIERYRLQPYGSATDALADTQRSFRVIRAHAKEWNVDPHRIGIMGFSAGGEQAAWVALKFDEGDPNAADPIDRQSCRPDFAVLVYAGWRRMDLANVPKNAPPAFITSAGIDDAPHARQSVEFYDAMFKAKIPVELHIYGHGGHANGIKPRNGIPFGTWHYRFLEWVNDLGMMKPGSAQADARAPRQ